MNLMVGLNCGEKYCDGCRMLKPKMKIGNSVLTYNCGLFLSEDKSMKNLVSIVEKRKKKVLRCDECFLAEGGPIK